MTPLDTLFPAFLSKLGLPDDTPTPLDQLQGAILKPILTENTNSLGLVTAGHLLKLIDIVGVVPPFRLVDGQHQFVTASLDRTDFKSRVEAWEFVYLSSRITQAWRTSLEVQVQVHAYQFRSREPQNYRLVATAHLVYVCLDSARTPVPLPPITLGSDAERQLAAAADARKQNRIEEAKALPAIALQDDDAPWLTEHTRTMTRTDTNIHGNVFGGVILEMISQAAIDAARRHTLDGIVAGVRLDRMSFIAPAFHGETVRARAVVTKTWQTSMELQVEVDALHPQYPQQPRQIAQCYVVVVRLNPYDRKPAQVPEWFPQTEAQAARAVQAQQRRDNREREAKAITSAGEH